MNFQPTTLPGCFLLQPKVLRDERGCFVKVFHQDVFREQGLATDFNEEYYSVSRRGVLRGLHFQTPPRQHAKLLYCVQGRVLDAVVDLRVGSPTYGRHMMIELDAERGQVLYLAAGVAHGFYTLSEQALMVYKVTTTYSPEHDTGILWNSASIAWPDPTPILSARDCGFAPLDGYLSPFVYAEPA